MSFFKKLGDIFKTEWESTPEFGWLSISDEEEFSEIVMTSNTRPQVIYKHSTRCATSFFAMKSVEELSGESRREADFYIMDVIGQRKLSLQIAEQLGVRHESPQLIILKNGEVFWHGSHHRVNAEILKANM